MPSNVRIPSTNVVIIAGRMGRDPELKRFSGDACVANFSICNTEYFRDRSGEKKERATWVDVKCWNKQAEFVNERLGKGRPVQVEGKLEQETWEDKQSGQKRSKIVLNAQRVSPLDWGDDDGQQQQPVERPAPTQQDLPGDEDIPF